MAYPTSLGAMILQRRTELQVTQQEVCEFLGWKEVYRLSDIERGKAGVDAVSLTRILSILSFTNEERGLALFLSGILPTADEGQRIVELFRPTVDSWEHGAYLADFGWHLHYANAEMLSHFGLEGHKARIQKDRPNLFDLVLDPGYPSYARLREAANWQDFVRSYVANFKVEHYLQVNEPWFRQLLGRLMRYPEFEQHWNELEETRRWQLAKARVLRGFNEVKLPKRGKNGVTIQAFSIFPIPVVGDERFCISLLVPTRLAPPTLEHSVGGWPTDRPAISATIGRKRRQIAANNGRYPK